MFEGILLSGVTADVIESGSLSADSKKRCGCEMNIANSQRGNTECPAEKSMRGARSGMVVFVA